jgi:uncharacterized protein (TIGR03437 family)
MRCAVLVAILGARAVAQHGSPPGIGQNGVANSASRIAPTLAGGALARGALFTISGVRFGLPGNTRVNVIQRDTTVPADVLEVRPKQIDARLPNSAPLGAASIVVTVDEKPSKPFPVEIVDFNPGLFSRNGEGWGPGRIDNFESSGKQVPNSTSHPARPGQRIVVVATGLGTVKEAALVIGTRLVKSATVRTGTDPGEQEIVARIPADVQEGCYVPVFVRVTPGRASNVVTMAIRSSSGPCDSRPIPPLGAGRAGVGALMRTTAKAERNGAPDSVDDNIAVDFAAIADEPSLAPLSILPPSGTCAAYTSSYQSTTNLSTSISAFISANTNANRGLDAGASLTLSRDRAIRQIPENRYAPGEYRTHLGAQGASVRRRTPPLVLEPGEYSLSGSGGRDVGPFRLAVQVPAPVEWIDRDQIAVVDRKRGATVHWKNAAPGSVVLVAARNVGQFTTAIGMAVCAAPAPAGTLTIPPEMLANIPESQDVAQQRFDELAVVNLIRAPAIKAAGLDGGFFLMVYATARLVEYR